MEFTQQTQEPFGEQLAALELETNLGLKTALVFRLTNLLIKHGCIAPASRPLVELCFDEALTNAMVHGNGMDPAKRIRAQLFCDEFRWGCIIVDEGNGFNAQDAANARGFDLLSATGRGILLMDRYLDGLTYFDGGRQVLLVKRREKVEEAAAAAAQAPAEEMTGFLEVTRQGEVGIVRLIEQRFSDANVARLKSEVGAAIEESKSIILDFARVVYISSVVMGALVGWLKHVRGKGGQLKLAGVQQAVMEILKMSTLDRIFDFQPDVDAALASLED